MSQDGPAALQTARESLDIGMELDDPGMVATACILISQASIGMGNLEEAIGAAQDAVPLYQQAGDVPGLEQARAIIEAIEQDSRVGRANTSAKARGRGGDQSIELPARPAGKGTRGEDRSTEIPSRPGFGKGDRAGLGFSRQSFPISGGREGTAPGQSGKEGLRDNRVNAGGSGKGAYWNASS